MGGDFKIMNIDDVNKIIDKIDKSSLSFFELDIENCHIKIDKSAVRSHGDQKDAVSSMDKPSAYTEASKAAGIGTGIGTGADAGIGGTSFSDTASNEDDDSVVVVKSPIVGTFYAAPSPDSDNFVSIGSAVQKGDTLCIIESMKLMNEIESEESGEIVEIIAKDKAMVEYGQPLFKIRRA